MVIISKAIINSFAKANVNAEAPLQDWYEATKNADWKNFNEMRQTFNSVDAVGNDRYVFNIKGNSYRLIALIIFKVRTVFVLFIGTHTAYDKINAERVAFKK
ncbi:type II toxin-antitoxin system HigB family toxin [Pedobacter heparinus]|uniref:type II toxin-antitoxin system HigB family toxin n=1 Tax=Pedobacter heparinus TaxID=984 RepID=UPI00293157A2|nr:type II toxin-antitoxin system HigB family toxin [Pedobacter heparinus]